MSKLSCRISKFQPKQEIYGQQQKSSRGALHIIISKKKKKPYKLNKGKEEKKKLTQCPKDKQSLVRGLSVRCTMTFKLNKNIFFYSLRDKFSEGRTICLFR